MKAETYVICSGPFEEDLAVVGDPDFSERNLKECVVYAKQLAREFGEPPARSDLIVKSEIRDFGVFWTVAIRLDPESPEAVAYANRLENGSPRWDRISLEELGHGSVINNLDAWQASLYTLIQHLNAGDVDASHEAVFILLVQGLGLFGEGPMMQFFPVVDSIKGKIDRSDLGGALRQALVFRQQLDEVKVLVCRGAAYTGQGIQASPTIPPDAGDPL
jgi:hypothetical protein